MNNWILLDSHDSLSLRILSARERRRTAGLDSIQKAMSPWLEALTVCLRRDKLECRTMQLPYTQTQN